MRLSERDRQLIAEIISHRALTSHQVRRLRFFGSQVRCNDRLRKLKEAAYLRRLDASSVQGPLGVYQGTAAGADLVAADLGYEASELKKLAIRPLSLYQLEHTIQATELRLTFEASAAKHSLDAIWTPELLCRHEYSVQRAGAWQKRVFKPDGLVRLECEGWSRLCFVEVDLGHVSQKRFAAKIESCRHYLSSVFEQTYGEKSFAVLTVTTSDIRSRRLAGFVKHAEPTFLFTTFDLIRTDGPFAPIWSRRGTEPRPLLDALGGSA